MIEVDKKKKKKTSSYRFFFFVKQRFDRVAIIVLVLGWDRIEFEVWPMLSQQVPKNWRSKMKR